MHAAHEYRRQSFQLKATTSVELPKYKFIATSFALAQAVTTPEMMTLLVTDTGLMTLIKLLTTLGSRCQGRQREERLSAHSTSREKSVRSAAEGPPTIQPHLDQESLLLRPS